MTTREKILFGILLALVVGYIAMKKWEYPAAAAPYLVEIANTEATNGIPDKMLGRLLYQESHFRPDIISGATVSPAGAIGIAQIVPKYHPNVDPRDPVASIRYAGQFLAQLKRQFGTWDKALAAYNTGAGNVQKAIASASNTGGDWLAHAADETQNYVSQIFSDLGMSRPA